VGCTAGNAHDICSCKLHTASDAHEIPFCKLHFISLCLIHAEQLLGWTASDAHNMCSCKLQLLLLCLIIVFSCFEFEQLQYVVDKEKEQRVMTLQILNLEFWLLYTALPLIAIDECMLLQGQYLYTNNRKSYGSCELHFVLLCLTIVWNYTNSGKSNKGQ
jgi:hypothetical protein